MLGKLRCVCAAVITKSETKTRKPDKSSQRNENERSAVEVLVDFVPGAFECTNITFIIHLFTTVLQDSVESTKAANNLKK